MITTAFQHEDMGRQSATSCIDYLICKAHLPMPCWSLFSEKTYVLIYVEQIPDEICQRNSTEAKG